MKIFKYPFQIEQVVTISIPDSAKILHVGLQANVPTMWALVNPGAQIGNRTFIIYGTGHQVREDHECSHIATLQMPDGLVWHIFDPLILR